MSAADAAFACALEHWQAGSWQAAHAACLEALGHDEGHVAAAVLSSEILLRVGEPRPAVALLEHVARLTPDDGAALLLLARAQRRAGEQHHRVPAPASDLTGARASCGDSCCAAVSAPSVTLLHGFTSGPDPV